MQKVEGSNPFSRFEGKAPLRRGFFIRRHRIRQNCVMVTSADALSRDVFISHASEDKDAIARPLADELIRRGLNVWFDEHELLLGDPLRRKIDEGLAQSTIGVVILSHDFFAKEWPQLELDGLHARLTAGEENVIVPVWHNLTKQDLLRYSPLMADLLGGKSTDGVERLADGIERVLSRRGGAERRTRRRKRFVSTTPAQPAILVKRAEENSPAAPLPTRPPAERIQELVEHTVTSLEQHPTGIPVTIVANSGLVAELSRRGDGVVTIRSRFLNPQQRVLPPDAKAKIRELTTSLLKRLTPRDLGTAEVRSTPIASSELPPRLLASEEQVEMSQTLATALRRGSDPRSIKLREDHGSLSLKRTGQIVKMSVSRSSKEVQPSSFSLDDAELVDHLLAGLTAISRHKTFRGERLEDSFPLSDKPSYSKLRVLTEQLIRSSGQFSIWQKSPVQRFVLKARRSHEGSLVLERPGSVPSVQQFKVLKMMAFVETLEDTLRELLASRAQALEVFATGLLVDLGPGHPLDPSRPRHPSSPLAVGG